MRTLAVLATTGAALTATAMPASAAQTKTVYSGYVSVAAAAGVGAGATVSVVQHCPAGTKLDKAATRAVTPQMDPRLRMTSRELWVAGTVSRFRVMKAVSADKPALVLTAAFCQHEVASNATTLKGKAATDLRLWGPAAAKVGLANGTVAVAADGEDEDIFRTAMQAAGVDEHPASMRGSVKAVQEVLTEEGLDLVAAVGQTQTRLRPGQFASLRNHFTFSSDLNDRIATE